MNNTVSITLQSIQQKIATLFFSGVYLSSHDIIQIAKSLDIDLPSKEKEILIKYLFQESAQNKKTKALLEALHNMITSRENNYHVLISKFPSSKVVAEKWLTATAQILRSIDKAIGLLNNEA